MTDEEMDAVISRIVRNADEYADIEDVIEECLEALFPTDYEARDARHNEVRVVVLDVLSAIREEAAEAEAETLAAQDFERRSYGIDYEYGRDSEADHGYADEYMNRRSRRD